MISILIPVYNYDIRKLAIELHKQAMKENTAFEIIIVDDCSEEEFKLLNREISDLKHIIYQEEKINLGRSKIRNKLADKAKYENLLFLDCDSGIPRRDFVKTYLKHAGKYLVVYGGRFYSDDNSINTEHKLHWLYGKNREQASVKSRSIEPNRSFQTNNFLIRKNVIQSIGFNENITGYGHEDTLFGYELTQNSIQIKHIDNPVIHLGLESSEEFLRKTREGIKNLRRIMRINGTEKKLVEDITILSYYKKIERFHLQSIIETLYCRYEHILRRNLMGRNPNLLVFDLYKLGYLCSINKPTKLA